MVPEDAWFLISAAFDPDLDNWRATLEEYEIADIGGDFTIDELNYGIESLEDELDISGLPTASSRSGFDFFVDLGIAVFDEWTGIDLEEDLFDHLEGQVSVAGWDFSLDEYGDIDEDRPPSVAILLAYEEGGERVLADTAEEILDLLEDEVDIRFEEVDVGADRDALVHYLENTEYSPGYVLSGGQWVFGLSEDTLADTVELQREGGDSLDSNPQYRRTLDLLPGVRHGLIYANLNEIIRQLDPEDLEVLVDGEYHDGQAILEEAIGSAAVSYTLGNQREDTLDRYAVVLTLFPE